jgi:hypothetical protein
MKARKIAEAFSDEKRGNQRVRGQRSEVRRRKVGIGRK